MATAMALAAFKLGFLEPHSVFPMYVCSSPAFSASVRLLKFFAARCRCSPAVRFLLKPRRKDERYSRPLELPQRAGRAATVAKSAQAYWFDSQPGPNHHPADGCHSRSISGCPRRGSAEPTENHAPSLQAPHLAAGRSECGHDARPSPPRHPNRDGLDELAFPVNPRCDLQVLPRLKLSHLGRYSLANGQLHSMVGSRMVQGMGAPRRPQGLNAKADGVMAVAWPWRGILARSCPRQWAAWAESSARTCPQNRRTWGRRARQNQESHWHRCG